MARDYTKYTVEGLGENLNKRQLVFTIVKDWATKNKPSFEEIQIAFPGETQGSKGFIVKASEVKDAKRFNIEEPLSIKSGTKVVVSNQWGNKNIDDFIAASEKLGYKISKSEKIIDFKEINMNDFEEMISSAIVNDERNELISLFNSLVNKINSEKENRYLIYLIPIFYNKIEKAKYEVDDAWFNFNLKEFTDEFAFEFSPERNESSGGWESTSDYTWTDPKNGTEGSFLQLLLNRIGVTVEDINAEKSNDGYIGDVTTTFLWFSMVKFVQDKVLIQGYDNEDLATFIWTVIEDPISDEISDVLCGEVYGNQSFFSIVAPLMLGFDMDHYNWEENDQMEGYGDYVHDFKAIAQDILNKDIFDII